ncbi:MAG: acetyl/propionyl/methylcrotonyl-CoA carboxylase subunit alpha [Rhodobacteraceae bacterium]|nr:acetyl/propionyl/methylcrotonyl-CoA carboxylase subunit alpha [Paracoccaceae bacterium]
MFHKILIANRGEIACRVIETARRLGVATVAVYSDADADARHVAMADEALHIGGSQPAQSYLRGEVILRAALDTGAEAIHPGYGFLSENPDFVEQVKAAGLAFIGPSAQAIRAMGLKDAAKVLMEKAGVPVVPGYHGADQDDAVLAREAGQIGYPVLIKAVAGGGGKGMRLVEVEGEFFGALDSARAEARTAFGNDDVLVEKYIEKPRHIEMQVFGDGSHAVHLYERDCSLQRRHQKVIEEAPAPGMTDEMRAAMGAAAVAAAEAIGYTGAGTVEFIVDGSDGLKPDRFWFMEMNTRLQVEHPVTEAVTGIDLVEWQLRVASGEGLPASQDEISLKGHAFEARLYAENVPAGFLPATGTLTHLVFPDGARADSGVRAGDTITPFYDPMIAKIITHGATRSAALRRMGAALKHTQVAGLVTNLGFLGALTRHEGFSCGDVDTGLIARDLVVLTAATPPSAADKALAALAATGLLQRPGSGFHIWTPLRRVVRLAFAGEAFEVTVVTSSADEHLVFVDGAQLSALCLRGQWEIDGDRAPAVAVSNGVVTLFTNAGLVFDIIDPLASASEGGATAGVIEAPMPGLVREVFCVAGQKVTAGERLAVLEAMKMEHGLTAARDGVVAEVLTKAGDQVEAGAPLIRLEEED